MVNPSAQSVSRLSLGSILFLLIACAGPQEVRLEKMGSTPASLPCKLESLTGTRDGEQMKARLVLASDSSRIALEIVLRIGVPTVLESGRYQWQRPTGNLILCGGIAGTAGHKVAALQLHLTAQIGHGHSDGESR